MSTSTPDPFSEQSFTKKVIVEAGEDVKAGYLASGRKLPLVIEPRLGPLDLARWVTAHRDYVGSQLDQHGAILFRGFDVASIDNFERFVAAATEGALKYTERSSPRSQVQGNIYTSTDYPQEYEIFPHNEQSYNQTFCSKIMFFCHTPATRGGETPLADVRNVFRRIAPEIRKAFIEKKYRYVRNFSEYCGLPWQVAFQTESRKVVEDYCSIHNIQCEWISENHLRTWQVRPVAARHPRTGEAVWFNHFTFFHFTTLHPAIRQALAAEFNEEDLPNHTYFGDGSRVDDDVVKHLQRAYQDEMVSFQWQSSDVLLVDNMVVAHGRRPYAGPRKVLVGMAEPIDWNSVTLQAEPAV
jgi:alpha-ketoglutarate-dependent taurine dioxygenase